MGTVSNGYMGNILRVDLTIGKVDVEPLPEDLVKLYIGGRGVGTKILYDELKPGISPLSPENKLVYANGPLTGSIAPSFSRWMVLTKSPQTGGIFRATAGGGFGAALKRAGYDVLIVEGGSNKPVYLWIKDDQVEIRDASQLWGLLVDETTSAIQKELDDERIKVATIGPGGEKLVRYASIVDGRRTASRGGVGTVMGSKKLKAIAVKGTKPVTVADKKKFQELIRSKADEFKKSPQCQAFSHLGTATGVDVTHALGIYPVRNFQDGVLDGVQGSITSDKVDELFVKDAHCHNCYFNCGSILKVRSGPYSGDAVEGPEYETVYSFGGMVGNTDLGMIIEANRICDDYGVDTITAGATIAFAMELYEKGILSQEELEGLDLTWGNHEAIITLLKKIVKREGIGDLLAEGTKRAAEKIGRGAEKYAMNMKGLEFPGYDPRSIKASGLNLATAAFGACHTVGQSGEELRNPDPTYRFSAKDKGKLCKRNQDLTAINDVGINCLFPFAFGLLKIGDIKHFFYAATGIEEFNDEEYLTRVGERIWNLERAFNVREGFSRKDDILPERFRTESPKRGPTHGQIFEMDEMLDDYYEARGWDKVTGIPKREKLESLGLKAVADELEKMGKIPS